MHKLTLFRHWIFYGLNVKVHAIYLIVYIQKIYILERFICKTWIEFIAFGKTSCITIKIIRKRQEKKKIGKVSISFNFNIKFRKRVRCTSSFSSILYYTTRKNCHMFLMFRFLWQQQQQCFVYDFPTLTIIIVINNFNRTNTFLLSTPSTQITTRTYK